MRLRTVLLFAAWTLVVWGTRIDNALDDGASAGSVALAVAMTAGGVAAGVAALAGRGVRPAVTVLAAATTAVWAVRVPAILLDDHSAGFVVVHAALAAISVALAAVATAAVRATRPARA